MLTPESNRPILVEQKYNITPIWTTSRDVLGIHVNTGNPYRLIAIQGPPLNCELVSSSYLLIVQNMLSTERIEDFLSKFPLDNSSGLPLNSSSFHLSTYQPINNENTL